MRNILARYSLPTQIVSDNGPLFQSAGYEEFLRQNGIQRILVSSYHPTSNGLTEHFVQTFKYAMESSADDPSSFTGAHHQLTGSCPTKLFLYRGLRARLCLVTPDTGSLVTSQQDKIKSNHDKFAKYRELAVGDRVLARDTCRDRSGKLMQYVAQYSDTSV